MKEVCECVKEWIADAKKEFGADEVRTDVNMQRNCLAVYKMIQPKKDYYDKETPKRRHSKTPRYHNSKDYIFCPFCGKELEDAP